jgi:hypothetical protein
MAGTTSTETPSLQRWGRNLRGVEPAVEQVRKQHAGVVANDDAVARAIETMAAQANNGDLPVSKALAAEMQALAEAARKIHAEEEALQARRRNLAARAGAVPTMYAREHETDEDRLNQPRNGRRAERQADVQTAEKDT